MLGKSILNAIDFPAGRCKIRGEVQLGIDPALAVTSGLINQLGNDCGWLGSAKWPRNSYLITTSIFGHHPNQCLWREVSQPAFPATQPCAEKKPGVKCLLNLSNIMPSLNVGATASPYPPWRLTACLVIKLLAT